MIERLKAAIDAAEGKPKIKAILLDVAKLPEGVQNEMLDAIQDYLEANK